MTDADRLHVRARELAKTIATRLARLESEREILPLVDRPRALVSALAELADGKDHSRLDR